MIAAMGARKIARPDMKDIRDDALYTWEDVRKSCLIKVCSRLTIFQGTMIQPAVIVVMITPRRMLMYLGNKFVMSFAQEITFALKFVPI